MVPRDAVYRALDSERDYQDAKRGNSARTDLDDNRDLGSMILLTEEYLAKARTAFSGPHPAGQMAAVEQLRKVGALVVLTMEYHGAPLRKAE